MKILMVFSLALFAFDFAWGGLFTVDKSGNQVEVEKSPLVIFMQDYSYDAFQKLNQDQRGYALRSLLMDTMSPDIELDYSKKVSAQNIISQHFNTLPEKMAKEIADNALWVAMLTGSEGLAKNLLKRFVPIYPAERTSDLCRLAQRAANVMSSQGATVTTKDFLNLHDRTLQAFSSLVEASPTVTDEKCMLSKNDPAPLSVKQLVQEINKKLQKGDLNPVSGKVAALPEKRKTACTASEIRSIFIDATEKIRQNGPSHKVFLAVGTMSCPVYGLVTQGPDKKYRYYPNESKENVIPPVLFDSAQDIASQLGRKEEVAAPVMVEAPSGGAIFNPFGRR